MSFENFERKNYWNLKALSLVRNIRRELFPWRAYEPRKPFETMLSNNENCNRSVASFVKEMLLHR